MSVEAVLFTLVILAGLYMAWNIGANDVANAMGTSVGSGALSLKNAVIIASILEFSGAFFFGSHVSETIQTGIVDSEIFHQRPMTLVYGMLAALLAAGTWLQLASYNGWPVATTHCIVGAVVGFGAIMGGWEAVYWDQVLFIATSWILSPIIGGILSFSIFNFLRHKIFFAPDPVEATKRITPPLVFIVLTTLLLVVFYKGLTSVNLNFFQSMLASIFLGGIVSAVSYFCLQRIASPMNKVRQEVYHPEVSNQLEKAKKHLQNVQLLSGGPIQYQQLLPDGPIQYQATELLGGAKNLAESLKKIEESGKESAEYALVEKIFGYLQIASACIMAFAHGANDVANAIGPLSAAVGVLTTGTIAVQLQVPLWALGLGGVGIVMGLATWGWRVIETIGKKITELTPTRGFAAEFGAAATILIASRLGFPISTTHTLVGSVIGVGMARGIEALDLGTMRPIVLSWFMTVPAGALITIVFFYIIQAIFG